MDNDSESYPEPGGLNLFHKLNISTADPKVFSYYLFLKVLMNLKCSSFILFWHKRNSQKKRDSCIKRFNSFKKDSSGRTNLFSYLFFSFQNKGKSMRDGLRPKVMDKCNKVAIFDILKTLLALPDQNIIQQIHAFPLAIICILNCQKIAVNAIL